MKVKNTGTEKMKAWESFSSGVSSAQKAGGSEELQDITECFKVSNYGI